MVSWHQDRNIIRKGIVKVCFPVLGNGETEQQTKSTEDRARDQIHLKVSSVTLLGTGRFVTY